MINIYRFHMLNLVMPVVMPSRKKNVAALWEFTEKLLKEKAPDYQDAPI